MSDQLTRINRQNPFIGYTSLVLLVASALVTALVIYVITRSITGPIQAIIAGLADGSSLVASASGEVSSAGQSLAEGAAEQASALEETAAAMGQMSAMTRKNAANSGDAAGLMQKATETMSVAARSMESLTSPRAGATSCPGRQDQTAITPETATTTPPPGEDCQMSHAHRHRNICKKTPSDI